LTDCAARLTKPAWLSNSVGLDDTAAGIDILRSFLHGNESAKYKNQRIQ
jgi:hypothetical protein